MLLRNSQISAFPPIPMQQCNIDANILTLGHLSRTLARDKNVVSNLRLVRSLSSGETGFVHDSCQLDFRQAREECGAAFLGLRCVHVQLQGCILIGPSLGNTDHRRKNCSWMAKAPSSS